MATARPILFSSPMVRALLDARKTQTRRILKRPKVIPSHFDIDPFASQAPVWRTPHKNNGGILQHCQYGAVGDYLWFREAWGDTLSEPPHLGNHGCPRAAPAGYQ